MRDFTVDERRARLATRHHLARSAKRADVTDVARSLIGLHATDPATVFLSAAARLRKSSIAAIEQAFYDDRTLVRILAMRRTMFAVPSDLVPMVQSAAANAVAARERKRLLAWIEEAGVTKNASRWLQKASAATIAALEERGEATTAELVKAVPELQTKLVLGTGTKWQTTQNAGSRVLLVLAAEGHIGRSRPRGSWLSTQHRWAPMTAWVPGGVERLSVADARVGLAQRWLRAFGPATVADFKWWTGWSLGEARKALTGASAVDVTLDGVAGVALADDLASVKKPSPWAALLPALDATVMGWTERRWFLGEHAPPLFDRSGNAGPTVWWDGRVVGGWAQRPSGEVVWRALEDVGTAARTAIDKEADRVAKWLGTHRVLPRFRTPLERELSA